MRYLISAFLIAIFLATKAIAFEPIRVEVRGHYSESFFEIKKEMGEWVCDSNSIQAYPLLSKKKLDYSWKKVVAESKRISKKSCERPMSVRKYQGAKTISIVTCASRNEAAKLLGQIKKICQPL